MSENTKVSSIVFSVLILGMLGFFVALAVDVFNSAAPAVTAPPTPTPTHPLQGEVRLERHLSFQYAAPTLLGSRTGRTGDQSQFIQRGSNWTAVIEGRIAKRGGGTWPLSSNPIGTSMLAGCQARQRRDRTRL